MGNQNSWDEWSEAAQLAGLAIAILVAALCGHPLVGPATQDI